MKLIYNLVQGSHTPFWEWSWGHGIRQNSGVLTKIGKFDIVLMYDVSNARLIPIIKLTLLSNEKREIKKLVWFYSIILWNCKYVTICSVFVLYEIKMENQKKKKKTVKLGFFLSGIGKKHTFWHWEWGRISTPKPWSRALWYVCVWFAIVYLHLAPMYNLGPSINGLVTDWNTKLCCRGFI